MIIALTAPKGSGKDLVADYITSKKYKNKNGFEYFFNWIIFLFTMSLIFVQHMNIKLPFIYYILGILLCIVWNINKYSQLATFTKIAYADQLKEILKLIFGLSQKELFGSQEDKEKVNEEWGFSFRQIGVEFCDFIRYTLPDKFPGYKEKIGADYFVNYLIKQIKINKNYVISDIRFNNEISELRKYFPERKIILIRLHRNRPVYNIETDAHHSENTNNIDIKEIDFEIENNGTIEELYSKIDNIISRQLKIIPNSFLI